MKKLKNDRSIAILLPDKGNGVVLDQIKYNMIKEIISDKSKI